MSQQDLINQLGGVLRSRDIAYTPSSGQLINYSDLSLGKSVNPITSITEKNRLSLFAPSRTQAEKVAEKKVPEPQYARVVGVTLRNFPNDPIPEWRLSQGNQGVLIPGEVRPTEFLQKAEQVLTDRHRDHIASLAARGASRTQINEANAKHERNIVRLRTNHPQTIANAIGAMGFPAAIAPEQSALVMAQPHRIESLRRFDPSVNGWVEADDRTARVTGSHMNEEGRQGPILETPEGEEHRPFWTGQ